MNQRPALQRKIDLPGVLPVGTSTAFGRQVRLAGSRHGQQLVAPAHGHAGQAIVSRGIRGRVNDVGQLVTWNQAVGQFVGLDLHSRQRLAGLPIAHAADKRDRRPGDVLESGAVDGRFFQGVRQILGHNDRRAGPSGA